jgi:hypothetical protein
METLGNKIQQNSATKFFCECCDYYTNRKCNYTTHLISTRHCKNSAKETFGNEIQQNSAILTIKFSCEFCKKEYNNRSSLWKHKKCCIHSKSNKEHDNICDKDLILTLLKQNAELLEIIKNGTNNTNIINSNNKTFNLQVFLNETCKDAMNISDFIESIKLQVSDLENVGKVGYIEGISNIIIKNLQALDVEKRPVHCTDQKREVMYVKDENIWEKEDESNKRLRKAIRTIAHKNICMLKAFREKYPDCEEYNSKKNSQYNKIVIEAMGGKGDDDFEKDSKIIKKIAKVVGIEKN